MTSKLSGQDIPGPAPEVPRGFAGEVVYHYRDGQPGNGQCGVFPKVPSGFFGDITFKFQAGELTLVEVKRTFRP